MRPLNFFQKTLSLYKIILSAMHFKDQNYKINVENPSIKKDELEKYENLQTEYKKLFAAYEQIKNENPQSEKLEQTVKQLDSKHQEIQEVMSQMY